METFAVETREHTQFVEITRYVQSQVTKAGLQTGIVNVFIPHTTAGITINESADPNVMRDILAVLDQLVPWRQPFYQHGEGNTASHVKASLLGSSVTVHVEEGRLALGTWQGVFLGEFDGPRTRKVQIECVPGHTS